MNSTNLEDLNFMRRKIGLAPLSLEDIRPPKVISDPHFQFLVNPERQRMDSEHRGRILDESRFRECLDEVEHENRQAQIAFFESLPDPE